MDDTNSLIEQRKAKLAALRAKGIDPFKNKFTPAETCQHAREHYAEGREVALAGRITAHRDMGKTMFIDIRDQSGRMQIYAQKNVLGDEQFDIFQHLDLGDFIGVRGTMFTTKTERNFRQAHQLRHPGQGAASAAGQVARTRRHRNPLPPALSRFDGEPGGEGGFPQAQRNHPRDPEFSAQARLRGGRDADDAGDSRRRGGATVRHQHNALGCDFYLRIALELYLKRLLVGGVDKVFEIGRNFRNEGLSRKHNPEFTMLEAYEAYGDYESMMELVQGLVCHVAENVLDTLFIEHKDAEGKVVKTINLTPPWRRVKYKDLVREKAGADWFDISPAERRQRAHDLGAEIGKEYEDFEVTGAVFEKLIEPTLIQPTFVTHLPKELVPLAKLSPDDPTTVEVFECCINGQEIAPAYTEQNDPIEQRERLEHQAGGEQQKLDEDFLVALEHGMPPAGGMGMGIDRLCMMLLGQESIRDVILFPQLKPKV